MKPQSLYSQLELIPEDYAATADRSLRLPRKFTLRSAFRSAVKQVRETLLHFLTHSSDPRVEERIDRHGNRFFAVYDPVTRQSSSFGSEQELRSWIDQRYYQ